MRRIVNLGALAAASIVVVASPVSAHGRFPATHGVTFHPSDPSMIVAASTFGPVRSTDGGETWRWVCADGLGLSPLEDPTYALMADGALLSSGFNGIRRGEPSFCRFTIPDPDVEFAMVDLARSALDGSTAFAPTSAGGSVVNRVFRTTDDGLTWEPTSDPIEPILFESIAVGPDDRLYLSGIYPVSADRTEPEPFVHRSVDGGATWERFAFAPFAPEERTFLLLAVDPMAPERLFARVLPERGIDRDERLVRSLDGGETWGELATHRQIGGMTFAPDGTLYLGARWVAMPGDPTTPTTPYPYGLYRSEDGGDTFTQVRDDLDVGCLAWHEGSLWACADNYRDGFLLGESTDGGETFEPRLVLRELLGPVACAPGDPIPVDCELGDQDIQRDFVASGTPDAGPGAGDDPGGCGCRTTEGPGRGAFLLVVLALTIRRRTLYHRE